MPRKGTSFSQGDGERPRRSAKSAVRGPYRPFRTRLVQPAQPCRVVLGQGLLAIRLPFLAKVSFQILLTRRRGRDRVPASPSARAGTIMAAIRTKFKVALKRSRFPESDWTVVGITAAYLLTAPSQQLKELPETLAKKKAIWNPQNKDHRCFMWCVLAHCLGVEGLTWRERKRP